MTVPRRAAGMTLVMKCRSAQKEGVMDRTEKIMNLVALGFSYGDIGEILGMTRSAVSGVVHRNRTTPPDPKRALATVGVSTTPITDGQIVFPSKKEAAAHYSITPHAAYQRAWLGLCGWSFADQMGA